MTALKSLFLKRELLWQFLMRNVKSRHRGSILGGIWLLANPLLMLGLYVFAFGVVFGGRFTDSPNESTLDFALGIFLGLSVLSLVSGVIGSAPSVIVSQPNFVKKVVFPLEILPAASVGALAYDLLIGLTLCLLGVAFVGPGLTWQAVYIPLIIAPAFYCSWLCLVLFRFGRFRPQRQSGWVFPRSGSALFERGYFIQRKKPRQQLLPFGHFSNGILSANHRFTSFGYSMGGNPNWNGILYAWFVRIGRAFFRSLVFQSPEAGFADVL